MNTTEHDSDDVETEQQQETVADDSGSLEFVTTPPPLRHHHTQQQQQHSQHHHHHQHHDLLNRKDNPAMYPAALKLAMRNHLRTLCSSAHCVDSLVVYLSSPTRSNDGASLLWDADLNGEVDETEVYTVREFLRDIQDCAARQVVVMADQNHSELLIEALQRSKRHSNVVAFASGTAVQQQQQQQKHHRHLTHFWANYQYSHKCLSKVYQVESTALRIR